MDTFLAERSMLIEIGKKTGKCRFPRHSSGKVKVSAKQTMKTKLKKPKDQFWKKASYKKRFGWPPDKKKGHRAVKIGPHVGVAVPGDEDSDVPWELEREFAVGVEMEDVVTDGEDSEGVGGETKFHELVEQGIEDYDNMVQGQCIELPATTPKKEPKKEEVRPKKEEVRPAPSPVKVEVTVGVKSELSPSVENADVGFRPSRSRQLFGQPSEESNTDRVGKSGKAKTGKATAKNKSNRAKREPGSLPTTSARISKAPKDNASSSGKAGRQAKDLPEYSISLLKEFCDAKGTSVFFDRENSTAQYRSLGRYVSMCREKIKIR